MLTTNAQSNPIGHLCSWFNKSGSDMLLNSRAEGQHEGETNASCGYELPAGTDERVASIITPPRGEKKFPRKRTEFQPSQTFLTPANKNTHI